MEHISHYLENMFEQMSQAVERRKQMYATPAEAYAAKFVGVPTGLPSLDMQLKGLQPSQLIAIVGAVNSGKTALCSTVLHNATSLFGAKVAVVSLKEVATDVADRLVRIQTGVSLHDLNGRVSTQSELQGVFKARLIMDSIPLYCDDGVMDMSGIIERVENLTKKQRLNLLIVDGVENIRVAYDDDNQNFSAVSRTLKHLAQESRLTVIAACRTPSRRERSERGEKDWTVTRMLEIEHHLTCDSDAVLRLERGRAGDWGASDRSRLKCSISKHRHGPSEVLSFNLLDSGLVIDNTANHGATDTGGTP